MIATGPTMCTGIVPGMPTTDERLSLLLDFGGQACHGQVVNQDGECIARAEHPNDTREDGVRVELDGEAVVAGFGAVLASLDDALKAQDWQIERAALAVQRGSVIAWDRRTGRALSPMLSWRDRRTGETTSLDPDRTEWVRQRTGLRWSPYAGAPKMRWMLEHLEPVRQAADEQRLAFGPAGSFLLARLLSNQSFCTDDSLAQRTLLWSRKTMDWDGQLLDNFGLERETLPQVCPSGFHYGCLNQLAGQPSLDLLIGDQNAVPFLTGQPDCDCLYVNLGTGGFVLRPVDRVPDTDRFQLSLLSREGGGLFALEGSIHGAATALNWLADRSDGAFQVGQVDALCETSRQPPLFLNTLDGLGSPWWTDGGGPVFEQADGDCDDSLAGRALAIIESIVFLVRANLEAMNQHLQAPKRIVLSGGLSRSQTLCRRLADSLGLPVQVLIGSEGTTMGAWCLLDQRHVLPETAWQSLKPRPNLELELRYRQWLKLIETRLSRKAKPSKRKDAKTPG